MNEELKSRVVAALSQYRDDLNHPPTKDSKERRLEMIERVLQDLQTS